MLLLGVALLALAAWSWTQAGRETSSALWVKIALLMAYFAATCHAAVAVDTLELRVAFCLLALGLLPCVTEWLPSWKPALNSESPSPFLSESVPQQDVTRELLGQVLELGTLRAGALRRPLHHVAQLPLSMSIARARQQLVENRAAWAAVLDDSGQVCGLLDFTRLPRGKTVAAAMRQVPILPELAPVAAGVPLLWERGAPFVLLVDEYGQGTGIIERGRWADTLLDRMPRAQGEAAGPAILATADASYLLDANLPLHEFRDRFGDPGVGDERTETILGFAEERLGRLLHQGDAFGVFGAEHNFDFKVVRTEASRPVRLELTVHEIDARNGT